MTDINNKIYKMLCEGMSLDEISADMGLSMKQVYKRVLGMIQEGYLLKKEIYDNGKIKYTKAFSEIARKSNTVDINLTRFGVFRAALISDTHIGSKFERFDYLDMVYDYCTGNGIHMIINAGDLLDGNTNSKNQNITSVHEQLPYMLENYPHDDGILNLICLGDHDYSLFDSGRDIRCAIESSRADMIVMGYGMSIVNIASDQFIVRHNIPELNFNYPNGKIVLLGHNHKSLYSLKRNGSFTAYIPSLSDLQFNGQVPGFMVMDLNIRNQTIINAHFKNLVITDKISTAGEVDVEIQYSGKNYDEKELIKAKTLKKESSQIDKFNARMSKKKM